MQTYLLDLLQCPACGGALDWEIGARDGDRIQDAAARCRECAADYPIQGGIGVFLTPDLPRNDLWEQVDSGLVQHLQAHPELERRLLDPPLHALAPADLFFRGMVLEERGDFEAAAVAQRLALPDLYTPEYRRGWDGQVAFVLSRLEGRPGPIVDLASGLGYLVEKMARALPNPIVASDFSPRVLRRDRAKLEALGLYERLSLLAFDVRRTPFKDGAIETLTTNVGLPNIEQPGALLSELRRAVGGKFFAITHFFPAEDETNRAAIRELGLEALLYRETARAEFERAGWRVTLENLFHGPAAPTPAGVILEGARPDSLPVAATELTWCTLVAAPRPNGLE